MRFLGALALLTLVATLPAPAAVALAEAAPVPIVGVWWTWVPPVAPAPHGTPVLWVGDTKHTVTTADSLDAALAGVANDAANADGDADTFHVELWGGPLSETFTYAHTFATPGDKFYFCRLHVGVGMVGVVSVVDAG